MTVQGDPILLVEDNPDDVLLVRRAFNRARIVNDIHVAGDGQCAIDYLLGAGSYADRQAHPFPGMVLLDLKLPRKSGFEFLEWLRQQPGVRTLPVVVLTSSRQDSDIQHAYDLGANSYLVKPVAFEDLLEMVKTLNLYWFVWGNRPLISDPAQIRPAPKE